MKILHLYPNLMNLYGDYGNIAVLVSHLKDMGIRVRVDEKEPQDAINLDGYDMIYMGPGTEAAQLTALEDLSKYRHILRSYIEQGKVALFTGNAMELLGTSIDGYKALSIINFESQLNDKRYTGDVIVNNEETGTVVGFINTSSTIIDYDMPHLFTYEFTDTGLPESRYEGYRYRNCFGTQIIGPVLVKNPGFLKLIVEMLAQERYQDIEYPNEMKAYEVTLEQLRKRR